MRKIRVVGASSLVLGYILLSSIVIASDYTIAGQASGSNNSVQIQNSADSHIVQENSATVVNRIKINSNTGGNVANENTGNSTIKTGDAKTTVDLNNNLNSDAIIDPCCRTPTPKSDPNGNHQTITPTVTPDPGVKDPGDPSDPGNRNSNDNNQKSGSSAAGIGGWGTGGGELLGLSDTSGESDFQTMITLIGLIFILTGGALLSVKKPLRRI
jgi:hypothetical protein